MRIWIVSVYRRLKGGRKGALVVRYEHDSEHQASLEKAKMKGQYPNGIVEITEAVR